MVKKNKLLLLLIPVIFILLIIIYQIFFYQSVLERFGGNTAGGVSTILIILIVIFSVYESFSMGISGMTHPFLGSGSRAEKIIKTGLTATAKVLSLGENSKGGVVTINDQPYLNIKLKIDDYKNPPYETDFDTVIPRHMMPQFQPGAIFPVKIDPENPKVVVIDFDLLNDDFIYLATDTAITNEDKMKIQSSGINGNVKLIELSDTGKSENFKPVVKSVWEITPSTLESYTLIFKKALDIAVVDELKKLLNHSFNARIHPDNKEIIKIDISSLE